MCSSDLQQLWHYQQYSQPKTPLVSSMSVILLPQEALYKWRYHVPERQSLWCPRTLQPIQGQRVSFMGWMNLLSDLDPQVVQAFFRREADLVSTGDPESLAARPVWQLYQEMFFLLFRKQVELKPLPTSCK